MRHRQQCPRWPSHRRRVRTLLPAGRFSTRCARTACTARGWPRPVARRPDGSVCWTRWCLAAAMGRAASSGHAPAAAPTPSKTCELCSRAPPRAFNYYSSSHASVSCAASLQCRLWPALYATMCAPRGTPSMPRGAASARSPMRSSSLCRACSVSSKRTLSGLSQPPSREATSALSRLPPAMSPASRSASTVASSVKVRAGATCASYSAAASAVPGCSASENHCSPMAGRCGKSTP
mmetsp:Transcript_17165/g.53217  ORF Transcript_17165/g.53217 Transcript_17165/m.53217 type:complete len:236 (-) Transcript_17165:514-1221(-)